MLKLVEVVAVAGERHPGVGAHRQANAGLMGRLEILTHELDRGFGLLRDMPRNTRGDAVRHNIADRRRRRDENRAPCQHHVDAFRVDEIAVLDRVRRRPRVARLMPSAPWACALAVFPATVRLLHGSPHLIDGELRIADIGAGRQDSAAGDQLDVVGTGLELLACGAS